MRWIRPAVVVILTSGVTIGFFLDKIPTETFAVFATGLIIYWFKSRDSEKKAG